MAWVEEVMRSREGSCIVRIRAVDLRAANVSNAAGADIWLMHINWRVMPD